MEQTTTVEPTNSWLRRLYHWTLSWVDHPSAKYALFLIALIESSVFPIPPDILLIALALGKPEWALRFAAITTAGSTVGAAIGYAIGLWLFVLIGQPIIDFYGLSAQFATAEQWFIEYGVAIVLLAGFSPIPFKVITISAGAFGLDFILFMLASIASRGARFFLEAAILRWGGQRLRDYVEKHFERMTMLISLIVIAGFVMVWWAGK